MTDNNTLAMKIRTCNNYKYPIIEFVKKMIFSVFFLSSLLSGCKLDKNKSSLETIKLNPYEAKDEIKLSEIVDSVKYIKLQTDPNCVMGQ